MKSKFGGLNNFLSSGSLTPKGSYRQTAERLDSAREKSSSRHDDKQKRKYEELDYEENRYRQPKRYQAENEEEFNARQDYKPNTSSTIRRTSSREFIATANSPRVDTDKYRTTTSKSRLRQQQPNRLDRSNKRKQMSQYEYANFQHVHEQTKHCVELLLKKTGNAIHNLNQTINQFKENLKRIVDEEYVKLQTVIMNVVENAFRSQMENIRRLTKVEEKKIAKDVGQVKEQLEHIHADLRKVREGIDGTNWKRFAGDFFKDDMENQVELLVQKSELLQVNRTVYLNYDSQKQQDFRQSLHRLLQVQLTTTHGHAR